MKVKGTGEGKAEERDFALKITMKVATDDFVELLIRNLLVVILHRHCRIHIHVVAYLWLVR